MTWCSPPAVSPADVATVAHRVGGRAAPRRAERLAPVGGAVLAGLIALALFLQFSIDDVLKRDEAIYAYGGQQLVEGVAPYASVFDPKTPLGTGFPAIGGGAARAAGGARGGGGADACASRLSPSFLAGVWAASSPAPGGWGGGGGAPPPPGAPRRR